MVAKAILKMAALDGVCCEQIINHIVCYYLCISFLKDHVIVTMPPLPQISVTQRPSTTPIQTQSWAAVSAHMHCMRAACFVACVFVFVCVSVHECTSLYTIENCVYMVYYGMWWLLVLHVYMYMPFALRYVRVCLSVCVCVYVRTSVLCWVFFPIFRQRYRNGLALKRGKAFADEKFVCTTRKMAFD